jgi:hypothetical protein
MRSSLAVDRHTGLLRTRQQLCCHPFFRFNGHGESYWLEDSASGIPVLWKD